MLIVECWLWCKPEPHAVVRKTWTYPLKSRTQATRPERAEAPSPGHRPGLLWAQPCRPVRAKALKLVIDYCLSSNDSAKIRQFPDTTKFQRVIRRDFQHAFNLKPVKQSNSPFCAPQLILFQRRKHRVKEKKTQLLIQYSVIQFYFEGGIFTP